MNRLILAIALSTALGTADQAPVETGVLPRAWQSSGPECSGAARFQVHQYNPDLIIFRESGCSHYEKPFLYLLFGSDKALLLDTGAGRTDVAQVVDDEIARWSAKKGRARLPLIVAHTHAHGDHVSGDADFRKLRATTVIDPTAGAVQAFFGIRNWPTSPATYDLGGRVLDVIPIPGHEASSIAVYDRRTAILFTGDTLYPGRLYVQDPDAFRASIQRLVGFTKDKRVAHVLGNHIEQTRTPYVDYPVRTIYQPDEHVLELGRAHLLELNEALRTAGGTTRVVLREFTIWPQVR